MVQLTIHVRPKDGYTYPNRIKTITVDSSYRLEQVIDDLKLDTKKGISIFSSQGRTELALNTSLASNNVQSGDILETCSSPMLSCVLSALMKDLEAVRENLDEDERTQEHVQPFLDLNPPRQTLDPWPTDGRMTVSSLGLLVWRITKRLFNVRIDLLLPESHNVPPWWICSTLCTHKYSMPVRQVGDATTQWLILSSQSVRMGDPQPVGNCSSTNWTK